MIKAKGSFSVSAGLGTSGSEFVFCNQAAARADSESVLCEKWGHSLKGLKFAQTFTTRTSRMEKSLSIRL